MDEIADLIGCRPNIRKVGQFNALFLRSMKYFCCLTGSQISDFKMGWILFSKKLFQYLLSNPSFAVQLIMGPNFPYAYRLEGPNSWTEARKAIEEASERIKKPLKNRQCQTKKHKYSSTKV